ncbi:carbohydrate binding domain-containing protein [Streptomyces sp. MBT53]|nr:carbohydrate binding domain-containing protein [Streptomyces sp. MBT53]
MPIPPASESADDRTALEPIRVLRPRNTDALAQLLDDIRQDEHYRGHTTEAAPVPQTSPEGETEELPPAPGRRTEQLPAIRPRLGPGQRRAAVVIAVAAAAVVGFGCSLLIPGPTKATTPAAPSPSASTTPTSAAPTSAAPSAVGTPGILANPGFESGGISPWNCAGNPGSIVSSPVHSGAKALKGTASSSDTAQCDQTVAVRPNTTYSLSGWVRGSYVYLGVSGGTSTWTTSPSGYSRLTVSFTTGPTQTSATVYVHGWYAQGNYYADDLTLGVSGGGGAT